MQNFLHFGVFEQQFSFQSITHRIILSNYGRGQFKLEALSKILDCFIFIPLLSSGNFYNIYGNNNNAKAF